MKKQIEEHNRKSSDAFRTLLANFAAGLDADYSGLYIQEDRDQLHRLEELYIVMRDFMDELKEGGRARKGWLNVGASTLEDSLTALAMSIAHPDIM